MRKPPFCTILLTVGMFLLGVLPAAAAPRYTCLELKTVPGMNLSGAYPRGIDAAGEVVGYAYLRSSSQASLSPSSGQTGTNVRLQHPHKLFL